MINSSLWGNQDRSKTKVRRVRIRYLTVSLAAAGFYLTLGAWGQSAPQSPPSGQQAQATAGGGRGGAPQAGAQGPGGGVPAPRFGAARVRPRVIVTTDGEIDDMCSMVRLDRKSVV